MKSGTRSAALAAGAALIAVLAALAGLVLPIQLEKLLLQQLDQFGLTLEGMPLRFTAPTELSLGPASFPGAVNPALSLTQMSIVFRPAALFQGRPAVELIETVTLSGLRLRAELKDGRLHIPALNLWSPPAAAEAPAAGSSIPPALPPLKLENAVFSLQASGNCRELPFSLNLNPRQAPGSKASGLAGRLLAAGGKIDFLVAAGANGNLRLWAEGREIEATVLGRLAGLPPAIALNGRLGLDLEMEMGMASPAAVTSVQAQIFWPGGGLDGNGLRLEVPSVGDTETSAGAPAWLTIQRENPAAPWRLRLNRLRLLSPLPLDFVAQEFLLGPAGATGGSSSSPALSFKGNGSLSCREAYAFLSKGFSPAWQLSGNFADGNFSARLGLDLQSEHNPIFQLQGRLTPEFTGSCHLELPAWPEAAPLTLPGLPPGTDLSGRIRGGAEITGAGNKLKLNAFAEIEEGTISRPDLDFRLTGINGRINFPDLPASRSEPAQKVVFGHFRCGKISGSGGQLLLQLEEGPRLFVEKGRLEWCGGRVEVLPFRIIPGRDLYQTTLFCDRLQLAELLAQLAGVESRGQGSVNGRIPLLWEDGQLTFDDGFLYSTPGTGGSIRISNSAALTTGLPPDSPEFAQLDLAREALRDYEYDWTKLALHSTTGNREELTLKLQFDGHPRRPLPFVYREDLGRFVRLETGAGSNFQGISLDLNLHLPLNRIIRYKGLPERLR